MRYLIITILFPITLFSCQQNHDHPRILLLKGEESSIKKQIAENETWAKLHQAIIDDCEKILKEEPPERVLIGRRLLETSSEYLRRIFYLSYAYRMTGDNRFSTQAERHMLKSAGFTDWNPSHFLDVSLMTMALAIGYDWLFDELPDESKQKIKEAIVAKGIEPSFIEEYNWFLKREHNWNQVCNAGITYGAMAIMEDYPELADSIVNRAFKTIPKVMVNYGPDGAYPEGYIYWGFGTSFNVLFLSAVETYFGTDRGLTQIPGFLKTGEFMQNMLAPSVTPFNWSDTDIKRELQPAMFWFAETNNDPSLLWMEKMILRTNDFSEFLKNRYLPALLIWGKNVPLEKIPEPASKVWVGQGKNPVCLMRTSWSDPNAIYLGYKVGSPSVTHGHMDVGSFVMEAEGIRWSMDLGFREYEALESKGLKLFGHTQDAQRWTIFRLNNYSHSVLTINDKLQSVKGYAKIDKYSNKIDFMNAVSDISEVYNGQLKKATRGVGIVNESYAVVRDEIETLDNSTTVRWNMVTPADVELKEKGAKLTKEGKTLFLKVKGSANIKMKTWSTAPTNDYDLQNPGTIMVGFECEIPANTKESFEVLLVPSAAEADAQFLNETLAEW